MKQKGFTLIELLAVIVILAIIALIATPIVLNIIKDSKESANLQSAQFYIDAAEMAITKQMMDDPTFEPSSCDVQSDGNLKCGETLIKVEVSGEKPTSGTITLENGKTKEVELIINEKTIVEKDNKLVFKEESPANYIIDVDVEFAYDETQRGYAAYLPITKEFADKLRVYMDYDYIIDNGEARILNGTEFQGLGFLLNGQLNNEQLFEQVFIEDERLIFVSSKELTGKHNVKIANPRQPEERIFFQIYREAAIVIHSYDFVLGEANILIKDNEGTEYYNNIVELEVNSCTGLIVARLVLPELYSALINGKTITIEVTQMVDDNEIVSTISRDNDSMVSFDSFKEYYLSSKHIVSLICNGGC